MLGKPGGQAEMHSLWVAATSMTRGERPGPYSGPRPTQAQHRRRPGQRGLPKCHNQWGCGVPVRQPLTCFPELEKAGRHEANIPIHLSIGPENKKLTDAVWGGSCSPAGTDPHPPSGDPPTQPPVCWPPLTSLPKMYSTFY